MEPVVAIFRSFEEADEAERQRRADMTPEERMRELAVLQERVWGERWTCEPMVKVASWETDERWAGNAPDL